MLLQIGALEIVDTDVIFDRGLRLAQTEPISPNFENVGYGSMYGIRNFGLLSILACLAPVSLLFGYLVSKLPLKNGEWIYRKIRDFYIWKATVSFLIGSFLPLMMCAAINTLYVHFDSFGDVVNLLFTLLGIFYTTVVPLYVMWEYSKWWILHADDYLTDESDDESSISEWEDASQIPEHEEDSVPGREEDSKAPEQQ